LKADVVWLSARSAQKCDEINPKVLGTEKVGRGRACIWRAQNWAKSWPEKFANAGPSTAQIAHRAIYFAQDAIQIEFFNPDDNSNQVLRSG
jgi:hypothetical protein